ncbi:cationic amino acid transporter 2-like [Plakobranchus ocellatus]|uniref:Cationic amino acid transporter 2-like n=1 Tax=Plakobranchus ocellatus TaxID=259542 RepID=A0AAV3ZD41_9GAST|nr:cationic amino acid transporter 2-like [Plakobranchus ocellatus]
MPAPDQVRGTGKKKSLQVIGLETQGGVGGCTMSSELVMRSAGTFLSRVRAPLPTHWPDGETSTMQEYLKRLVRKKVLSPQKQETNLSRCLTVYDLIFLGIGSTLGAGLYVVIGEVAKQMAGPAVIISFLVAAVASAFSGLCYAEFAARIPRAGSAYVYSYVTVGEFVAFIIGWNLILEYVIGTASVARAYSSYFDSLIGKKMSKFFHEMMPMHIPQLSEYPDFFALGITLLLTLLLILGVKESARFNNVFTCVNLLVVTYVTICGLFKIDFQNWNISADEVLGLCYAEFAARIPRAGSAYVYSYVTVGEFVAFIIGWNLILEYVIGTASVARAYSSYFDSLIGKKMSKFFHEMMPMHIPQLSEYPDFFALGITLLLTLLLIFGVKESARFNNVFTCVNLLVVTYVTICGLFKIDFQNWNISADEVPEKAGTGGFMPFGFSGTMAGAATCFYAFVGFDCVATTGEETKNPQRSTPIAVIVSLLVVFLAYFSVSAVVTLMCPYYLLDPDAALPAVFQRAGWGVARYLVAIGAMSALSTSLLGAMFPLPRILYAMGVMAMIFNLQELVEMMSIGTLLAYTLVSLSVLILRYETDENLPGSPTARSIQASALSQVADHIGEDEPVAFTFKQLFVPQTTEPTNTTSSITKYSIAALTVFIAALCWLLIQKLDELKDLEEWALVLVIFFGLSMFTCCLIIFRQPQNPATLPFKVPLVPLIPILSTFVNVYLMLKLSTMTWYRFGIWMVIGFLIYFGYGIRHATANTEREGSTREDGSESESDVPLSAREKEPLLHA